MTANAKTAILFSQHVLMDIGNTPWPHDAIVMYISCLFWERRLPLDASVPKRHKCIQTRIEVRRPQALYQDTLLMKNLHYRLGVIVFQYGLPLENILSPEYLFQDLRGNQVASMSQKPMSSQLDTRPR